MMNKSRLPVTAAILISTLLFSGAAFARDVLDIRDVEVGTLDKVVLREYGAADKIEKIAAFEVWNYVGSDSTNCQLFFFKRALSEPAKCEAIRK